MMENDKDSKIIIGINKEFLNINKNAIVISFGEENKLHELKDLKIIKLIYSETV